MPGGCQCAEGEAAVAYLIPIVVSRHPPTPFERRLEPFVNDCLADGEPRFLRQPVVQPVVADRKGRGHFGHVKEMTWIPAEKLRGREHFFFGALEPALLARHMVGKREIRHPAQDRARGCQHAFAYRLPPARRLLEHNLRAGKQIIVCAAQKWIRANVAANLLDIRFIEEQPRMVDLYARYAFPQFLGIGTFSHGHLQVSAARKQQCRTQTPDTHVINPQISRGPVRHPAVCA